MASTYIPILYWNVWSLPDQQLIRKYVRGKSVVKYTNTKFCNPDGLVAVQTSPFMYTGLCCVNLTTQFKASG